MLELISLWKMPSALSRLQRNGGSPALSCISLQPTWCPTVLFSSSALPSFSLFLCCRGESRFLLCHNVFCALAGVPKFILTLGAAVPLYTTPLHMTWTSLLTTAQTSCLSLLLATLAMKRWTPPSPRLLWPKIASQ